MIYIHQNMRKTRKKMHFAACKPKQVFTGSKTISLLLKAHKIMYNHGEAFSGCGTGGIFCLSAKTGKRQ